MALDAQAKLDLLVVEIRDGIRRQDWGYVATTASEAEELVKAMPLAERRAMLAKQTGAMFLHPDTPQPLGPALSNPAESNQERMRDDPAQRAAARPLGELLGDTPAPATVLAIDRERGLICEGPRGRAFLMIGVRADLALVESIVRAWNAHDELVAALRALTDAVDSHGYEPGEPTAEEEAMYSASRIARAALAKVTP